MSLKQEASSSWVKAHLAPRIRALFDLVLNLSYLVKTKDFGAWLLTWLTYLGIVGSMLTAIITAATRGVIYAADAVLRPHALPIISPALEKLFISWPQLAIGLGFHAHIITGLYFAAPAYTAALLLAALGERRLREFLFPRGVNAKDMLDHLLLWLVFATAIAAGVAAPYYADTLPAAAWQLLAPHIAVSILWIIYSLAVRGMAYKAAGLALTLVFAAVANMRPLEAFRDLEKDPWAKPMLEYLP